MNTYELTTVFTVEEELYAPGIEQLRATLSEYNVAIISEDKPIDRDLAYEIRRKQKGRYVYFKLKADPRVMSDINRQFRLNQALLTYLFVRIEE